MYKDGVFPGENTEIGGMNLLRITEANDPSRTLEAGARLTDFEVGMRTDPFFAHAEQDAIGHSWGLANIAASEVAGARYDKVISLSGAGMPSGWTPDPDTAYTDLSYDDLLQRAQRAGAVWEGSNPRTDPAFDHAGYYRGPDDAVLDDDKFTTGDLGVLSANHNLIATESDDNDQVLEDLVWWLRR